jgi:hypothetical protein
MLTAVAAAALLAACGGDDNDYRGSLVEDPVNVTTLTAWPTTADMLIYAPGTFLHGQGMSLDLGVVRDSVMNAENDFTAAWAEETHMVAKVGHEARKYTITFAVNGAGVLGQTLGAML